MVSFITWTYLAMVGAVAVGAVVNALATALIVYNRHLWTHTNTILCTMTITGLLYNCVAAPLSVILLHKYILPYSYIIRCVIMPW